jgi:hypothetical protein
MLQGFLRTLVRLMVASLILGTVMAHYGVSIDQVMREFGLSQERLAELAQRAWSWALPNLMLGSMVILPLWFLFYLFRPPRARSD